MESRSDTAHPAVELALRVVVLDCPYKTWHQPRTQQLFGEIVDMKIMGYRQAYPDGVLPVDTYDFIGTHVLICEEKGESLKPLSGFKSIALKRCERFNLQFPAYLQLRGAEMTIHRQAIDQIISRCKNLDREIVFDSSWAVAPEARALRTTYLQLQQMFVSNIVHWHQTEGEPERLGMGGIRVRTHRFFEKVGYERVALEGNSLPVFRQASLMGASVILMHLKTCSRYAFELAERYRDSWSNRTVIE